jgi:hypothetical protein
MKGKQLSLQEVLNLEDGTKVWVEELRESWKDDSQIFVLNKDEEKMYDKEGRFYRFDSYSFEDGDIEFYEWVEGFTKPKFIQLLLSKWLKKSSTYVD